MSPPDQTTSAPAAAQSRQSLARVLGQAVAQLRRLGSLPWEWEARLRGAELQGPVVFLGRPIITLAPGSSIVFGGENQLASSPRCTGLANIAPCCLRTVSPSARIEIGRGVGISGAAIVAARSVVIGEGTLIGAGAVIADTDFHRPVGEFGWSDDAVETARPISIGRGCFIGARAIVLKGVKIADRAAVAAGAVVTSHVPTASIAIGNPARIWPWTAATEALAAEAGPSA